MMDPEKLINPNIIKYALILSALLYVSSLYHRIPHTDDAWLGEIVYFNAKTGTPRSELMRGVTLQEVRNIVHHKLLTLGGTVLTLLFGFDLYTLKSLSLLFYLIFLLIFILYLRKKSYPLFVPLLLVLCNSLVFEFSFVFRPELMLMCFAFIAWIFYEKLVENQHQFRNSFFMGLSSGLAVATHLNGIFLVAAGFIVMVIYYRKYLITFIPGLLLTSCIYFYDFTSQFTVEFWWYQIANSPFITVSAHSPPGFVLVNALEEQMRFFNSPKEFSLTLLTLFSIYFLWKNNKLPDRKKILFLALIIMLMGIFSAHKTSKYMLIYFPFFVLIISKTWQFLNQKKIIFPKWTQLTFVMLLQGYLILNTVFNVQFSLKKYDITDSAKILNTYCKGDCSRLNIIAPMTYIFNNIEDFSRIHSDLYYTESYTKLHKDFAQEASSYNIDYIFLDQKNFEILGLSKLSKNDILGNYKVLDKSPVLLVLKNSTKQSRLKSENL